MHLVVDDYLLTQYCTPLIDNILNKLNIGECTTFNIGNYRYTAKKVNKYVIHQMNNFTKQNPHFFMPYHIKIICFAMLPM